MTFEIARTLPLSPSAPHAARRAVEGLEGGIPRAASEKLRLVVSELVTAAVLESGLPEGAPIRVRVRLSPTAIRVEVIHPTPGPDAEGETAGGVKALGERIIEAMCAEWGVERDGETRLWAVLNVRDP